MDITTTCYHLLSLLANYLLLTSFRISYPLSTSFFQNMEGWGSIQEKKLTVGKQGFLRACIEYHPMVLNDSSLRGFLT